ncbi:hypothetical protein BdWA1_003397 [Babesia duncani]|uniref:Uncharacterized protein n=1 Tax=Babesia duncani TaxID=323732 RepID=A0AAD9PHS3_9APIC|nr:hypothetical protein BdWA1_003397 [Babesia duncani]
MEKSTNVKEDKIDKLLAYLARVTLHNRYLTVSHACVDKELENQKQLVRDFFKSNNSTSTIAQHFINAGFDSLDSLTFLSTDVLDDIQAYNGVTWLPGHKIRVHGSVQRIGEGVYYQTVPHIKDEYIQERTIFSDTVNIQKIANLSAEATANRAIDVVLKSTNIGEAEHINASCYINFTLYKFYIAMRFLLPSAVALLALASAWDELCREAIGLFTPFNIMLKNPRR